jgi:selenide,water dikinase
MEPLDGLQLVVINPESTAPYSGMLPGFLAGQYAADDLFIDVAALCKQAGVRFIRGSLEQIDASAKILYVRHQALSNSRQLRIPYDYAVLNTGAAPAESFPSTHPACHYVKPIGQLLRELPLIDEKMREKSRSMVIVGGGAAGIELAFAFRARYGFDAEISLVAKRSINKDNALSAGASLIRNALSTKQIALFESVEVTEAVNSEVMLSDGSSLNADVVCVATPVRPPSWIEISGLSSATGFLAVNDALQVDGCEGLYAAGDIVNLPPPRGRSGVMAVRAGQYLASALWKTLKGQRVSPFRPQKRWLTLLNLGDGQAIAVRGALAYQARALFRLKDRIDQRFMSRFKPQPMSAEMEMRCEGCAAKLPGDVLASVFDSQFEDGAVTTSDGVSRIQSIDALSYLIDDPYLVGVLAMRHAVSDVWAMGATPSSVLTLIAVERALSKDLEATEFGLIQNGLRDASEAYQAEIIGGHSLSLQQPMVAVMVEGTANQVVPKTGAELGDEIWLTGPLGSGVLFAALASGLPVGSSIDQWIPGALESLFEASQIAVEEGVHAMTDVTGFGLAGHLKEMLSGSPLNIEWAEQISTFQGVDESIARGIRSTAHADNAQYAQHLGYKAPSPVVFDPQTCGPLMIAASSDVAKRVVGKWKKMGLSPQQVAVVTTETS